MLLLVFDVIFDLVFVKTNSGDKVSSGPEWSWGKLFGLLFDPRTGFSFQDLNGIRYWKLGWNQGNQMNVLIPNVPGCNAKTFPFADGLEYSLQFCFDIFVSQDLTSVPGCPDNVVLAAPLTMFQIVQSAIAHVEITSLLVVGDFIIPWAKALNAHPS